VTVLRFEAENEEAMLELARKLCHCLEWPLTVYMHGELGAGKTTFTRGIVQGLGHSGAVKSPTYTLVEPYDFGNRRVYHFDLYRLSDPEELEYMGIRDYFLNNCLCIIEWPSHGLGWLPCADLEIRIEYKKIGRCLSIDAKSEQGTRVLEKLHHNE
jgi:tRNA threonylcarbamoyladenosine biosynthesis protein TsaE